MSAATTALMFNDCINAADLAGLSALMAEAHTFVDSAGMVLQGKDECIRAWAGFFEAFPGYRNVIDSLSIAGNVVSMSGFSVCPGVPELEGPALWTAVVDHDLMIRWQVNDPSPPAETTMV